MVHKQPEMHLAGHLVICSRLMSEKPYSMYIPCSVFSHAGNLLVNVGDMK